MSEAQRMDEQGWLSGLHPTLPALASKLAGDPLRKCAKDGAPGMVLA